MSYFKDGKVTFEGRTILFTKEEAAQYENTGNYWHGEGDPSSWLTITILRLAFERIQPAPREKAIDLAYQLTAQVLGISRYKVEQSVSWHENYMRWHDGDDSYSVF